MRDLADSLGVDVSTISKVISGGDIRVREETRQAILAEAARQNYRPNATARSLKGGRTGALGMLFPDFTNPVYATIVRGAVRRADALGYVVLVAEMTESSGMSSYRRLVDEHRIDGLLVATAEDLGTELQSLGQGQVPYVFVNRRVAGGGPSVVVDDERAGALAAEHLLALGHSQLGFIGADDGVETARRRRAGFMAAATRAGHPSVVDIARPYSRSGGYEAGLEILDGDSRPTAVFASNLLVGIGLLAATRARGCEVPRDLSVITLDGEDAGYTSPPLTAIRMPLAEMGARAVEELDRLLKGEETSDVLVPFAPELVVRESVARRRT